jgi:uncharacterized repeat protein (TIGR01451 family)
VKRNKKFAEGERLKNDFNFHDLKNTDMKNIYLLLICAFAEWSSLAAQCPTPPQLLIPGGPNPVLTCLNTSVTPGITVNIPNCTWAWSGPAGFNSTQQFPTLNTPGIYQVTVTEPTNGCSASVSLLVLDDVTPPPVAATDGSLTCLSPNVDLVATSPLSGLTYQWQSGGAIVGTGSVLTTSTPGVYIVVATNPNNGCTQAVTTVVTSAPGAPIVTILNGSINCANPIATLTATSSTPGATIVWQNGTTGNTFTTNTPGTYTFVVTNPVNGCSVTGTGVVVADPSAISVLADAIDIFCNAEGRVISQVSGGVGPYTFLWSNGLTGASFNSSTPGVYTVTATDANGCTGTASATLGVNLNSISYTVNPGCANSSAGAIQMDHAAGNAYQWSNGATTSFLQNLANGTYCVTVTNTARNCTVNQCIPLLNNAGLFVGTNSTDPTCANPSGGFISVGSSGGTPPYTYTWNNGANTNPIGGIASGIYVVTVTDVNGCTGTTSVTLNSVFNLQAAPVVTPNNCTSDVLITTNFLLGIPLQYQWSNGAQGPTQTGLSAGVYVVTVTEPGGCSAVTTFILSNNCPQILKGTLRNDANNDCIPQGLEQRLSGWIIRASHLTTGLEYFAQTNQTGDYEMGLPLGNYNVEAIPLSSVWTTCLPYVVSFTAPGTIIQNIAVKPALNCPILDVNLTSTQMRRCFSGSYYVSYCNYGTKTADNAYVDVKLDPFLTYQTSSIPGVSQGNQVYRFQVGNVLPGVCNSFTVTFAVSCNATFGQTHCSEAHIYPDSTCLPPPTNWSGATLTAKAVCSSDSIRFTIKNQGTATMTSALDYIVIEDIILRQQGTTAPLAPNGTMQITVPSNGSSWRLEAVQEPNHPSLPNAIVNVEGCVTGGQVFSTGFINQFMLPDSMPWLDIDCTPNTGSYDPNDKAGYPQGYGANHYVEPNTTLEYLIRFQNTGTDTAFTVKILDTLDARLDPCTFRLVNSSHPVRESISGTGDISFLFSNIMLPDSNVNEPASNGFVRYRIAPRPGLPLETDVFNSASIYFDFNDPVVTNTTQHRFGEDFVLVRLFEVDDVQQAQIQPNPVTDQAWVSRPEDGTAHLVVTDGLGRILVQQEMVSELHRLDTKNWKSGVYALQIRTGTGKFWVGKMLVVR